MANRSDPGFDVYVIYDRSRDESIALRVADELRASGFTVFVDADSLAAGTDWSAAFTDSLARCRLVLQIDTAGISHRAWSRSELNAALDMGKPVVRVIGGDVPRLETTDPRSVDVEDLGTGRLVEVVSRALDLAVVEPANSGTAAPETVAATGAVLAPTISTGGTVPVATMSAIGTVGSIAPSDGDLPLIPTYLVLLGDADSARVLAAAAGVLLDRLRVERLWVNGGGLSAAVATFMATVALRSDGPYRFNLSGGSLRKVHYDIHIPLLDTVTGECIVLPDDAPGDDSVPMDLEVIHRAALQTNRSKAVALGPWRLVSPGIRPRIPFADIESHPRLLPVVIMADTGPPNPGWPLRLLAGSLRRWVDGIRRAEMLYDQLQPPVPLPGLLIRVPWNSSFATRIDDAHRLAEEALDSLVPVAS